MAEDARIRKIEELLAYSNHLGSFIQSMSMNFNSFNNVLMQKLQSLRQKEKEAIEIEAEAIAEWRELFRQYASCTSREVEKKSLLLKELSKAEQKRNAAQRLCTIVKQQVIVAKGAVQCMNDNTQTIQNKLRNNIDKGQHILKNAVMQLEKYKENSNKI